MVRLQRLRAWYNRWAVVVTKHYGPGPHSSGSPQSVHAGGGMGFANAGEAKGVFKKLLGDFTTQPAKDFGGRSVTRIHRGRGDPDRAYKAANSALKAMGFKHIKSSPKKKRYKHSESKTQAVLGDLSERGGLEVRFEDS